MVRRRLLRSAWQLLGGFLLWSCADAIPTEPTEAIEESASNQQRPSEVRGIWWENRYDQAFSVTRTIGPAGGTISLPETGLTVTFPAGALSSDVEITVTADADYVAYKFAPEGIVFEKDVVVTQSLQNTEFYGRELLTTLYAAYLDDQTSLGGKVQPLEVLPTQTIFSLTSPPLAEAQVWVIRHFSRYMLASG